MEDNNKNSDKPVFNMGIAYLERLNDLLEFATECSIKRNIPSWINSLCAIYRDISCRLSPEERKICKDYIIHIKSPNEHIGTTRFQYAQNEAMPVLEDFDELLRNILYKKGLIMPSKDDPGLAMIN